MPEGRPATASPPDTGALILAALCVLLAGVILLLGPILTNDGPAHLAMAHFYRVAGDPAAPMLNRVYELNPTPSPNQLGHLAMAALVGLLPPLAAEQALQLLCLLGIPLSGWLLLRRIAPEAAWLALFLLPVAMQRVTLLGLYNLALSIAGCLLCLWAWLALRDRPGVARALVLAGLLLLTLAAHVSGWMAACVALGTLGGTEAVLRLRAGQGLRQALRPPLMLLACLLPGLGLALGFLGTDGGGAIAYGAGPLERLRRVATGEAFATIGRPSTFAGLLLTVTLGALFLLALPRLRRAGWDEATRLRRLPFVMLPLAFLLLLLVVPEQAGGGWGHVWRSQALPYLGLVLAIAALPAPGGRQRAAGIAIGAFGAAVPLLMLAWFQGVALPPVLRAFDAATRLVPAQCSLVPVIGETRLDRANTARITHQPLLHLASRAELSGDRPVLYSYLARLRIYPVRYREAADPMRHLFGWPPGQRDLRVLHLDPDGYAARSGITVDFVLLWDVPPAGEGSPFEAVRQALTGRFEKRFETAGGRLELYGRAGSGGCGTP